ncbi:hypothetical protein [Limnobacter parvus]|uniref:Uncharacterized protein n=1 Tax=Limnobacter parvus TaxID=2939690 RepID=A0ABT1XJN6_9BURK|nr:hypothetical protein [Limnobacter parvus]MCR2746314.1 hypothetical protein [Limnobacter parvus]
MPVVKTNWVKKTLGACLAFSFSTLTIGHIVLPSAAHAHAEHGSEGGIPTVSSKAKLPKGISLQVVKSNAYQFALATDGQQTLEVLGEDKRPFLRFEGDKLYADLNAVGWHRSRQPGGGPVPDRLKENPNEKPNWILLDKQPGYGWYDPRLINEEVAHFNLQLISSGKPISVRVERVEAEPMTGYWRPTLISEPEFSGLNVLVPGLSGNALLLSRMGTAQHEFEILDDENQPFMELRKDGVWLLGNHKWAQDTGLFFGDFKEDSPWVKVSETSTVTYSDPRLDNKPGKINQIGEWSVPVKIKGHEELSALKGQIKWQNIEANANK